MLTINLRVNSQHAAHQTESSSALELIKKLTMNNIMKYTYYDSPDANETQGDVRKTKKKVNEV